MSRPRSWPTRRSRIGHERPAVLPGYVLMMVRAMCLTPSPGFSGTSISHKMPAAGETPKRRPGKWRCADRRVQSCVSGRTRGGREGANRTVGIRQAGGRGSVVGKDMPYGRTGLGSDAGRGLSRGETPTAGLAVRDLVRTRFVMSSRAVCRLRKQRSRCAAEEDA